MDIIPLAKLAVGPDCAAFNDLQPLRVTGVKGLVSIFPPVMGTAAAMTTTQRVATASIRFAVALRSPMYVNGG